MVCQVVTGPWEKLSMMSSTGWVAVIDGTVDCCLLTTLSSIEECFFHASSRELYNNVAVVASINGGGNVGARGNVGGLARWGQST